MKSKLHYTMFTILMLVFVITIQLLSIKITHIETRIEYVNSLLQEQKEVNLGLKNSIADKVNSYAKVNTTSVEELTLEADFEGLEYTQEYKLTAYCSCPKCCGIWSQEHESRIGTDYVQKTASGTIPKQGRTIAADTSVLPFGTIVIIDGNEYVVEDTGNAVKGKHIDIYFDNHQEAVEWGVQNREVVIK